MNPLTLERDYATLVQQVLGTDSGRKLLTLLSELYVDVSLFTSDHSELAYRVGKHDLVQELQHALVTDISTISTIGEHTDEF